MKVSAWHVNKSFFVEVNTCIQAGLLQWTLIFGKFKVFIFWIAQESKV